MLAFVASFAFALAPDEAAATLRAEGCFACHPDGGAGVGPSLVDVKLDDDALRRALADPGVGGPEGYPVGAMPPVAADRVEAVAAAVRALAPAPPASPGWFGVLGAGLAIFVGGHLGLSARPLRDRLLARLGEGGFMGLYSVVASVGLGLAVLGWAEAPFVAVWDPPTWTRWVPLLTMPLVLLGQVAGYTTPSPTVAGMADTVATEPRGIHRITRHPANITSALWALAHLTTNGDLAGIVLFTSVAILGVAGSLHIDARRARSHPEEWARYTALTSVVPFVAILQGRNRLVLREIGAWRLVGTVAAYGGILASHQWLIGASPWPW